MDKNCGVCSRPPAIDQSYTRPKPQVSAKNAEKCQPKEAAQSIRQNVTTDRQMSEKVTIDLPSGVELTQKGE